MSDGALTRFAENSLDGWWYRCAYWPLRFSKGQHPIVRLVLLLLALAQWPFWLVVGFPLMLLCLAGWMFDMTNEDL